MKKIYTLFFLILSVISLKAQTSTGSFTTGEWFKFRIHYGLVTAGYATLELKEAFRNNKKIYYAVGNGYTSSVTKVLFKVNDNYQSYFDKIEGRPYQYVRKIDEGGYKKDQEGFFNYTNNTVLVKDYKNNTEKTITIVDNVQDIVSSFYYLRNLPRISSLKVGESIIIDLFFDDEIFKFKLKYIGKEDIKTKFGKVSTLVFRPYVQAGRVFKEKESLTVWISDDNNRLPIRIKASLAVGSLKADLEEYKGLKNPLTTKD